jgi:hypothetical protein
MLVIEKNLVIEMARLECEICGRTLEVPTCCGESMMVRDSHLLCCCNPDTCEHKLIPICCGQQMRYI